MPTVLLDAKDLQILATLQTNGRLSNVELAEQVHLSPSPCLRRVKRLEQERIIEGYRATLNRKKIGLGFTSLIGLKVEGHQVEAANTLLKLMEETPEIISCYMVAGESDFLLEVVVPDLEHYERFLMETLIKQPMTKDMRSSFVIRTVKSAAPLPLNHLS